MAISPLISAARSMLRNQRLERYKPSAAEIVVRKDKWLNPGRNRDCWRSESSDPVSAGELR
jgi:hypothetical protein